MQANEDVIQLIALLLQSSLRLLLLNLSGFLVITTIITTTSEMKGNYVHLRVYKPTCFPIPWQDALVGFFFFPVNVIDFGELLRGGSKGEVRGKPQCLYSLKNQVLG